MKIMVLSRSTTNLWWVFLMTRVLPMLCLDATMDLPSNYNQQQNSINRDLIVNGQEIEPDESFPWFVFSKFGRARGCGGTLIHKDIVLAAAHCYVVFYDRGAYIGGRSDYGLDGTFHEDEEVTVHPFYDEDTYANDIMLVKLETASEAPTVALNFDPSLPQVGDEVTVMGFGDTRFNGNLSPVLLHATVNIVDREPCRDYYSQFDTPITYAQLCALDQSPGATNETRQDACQSDSGGPMLMKQGSDSWEQVGIISFSKGCARENVPGVYVKISAYKDWIETGICELSAYPPSSCSDSGSGGIPSPLSQSSTNTLAPGSSPSTSGSGYMPSNPSSSSGSSSGGEYNDGDSTIAPSPELTLTIFSADAGFFPSGAVTSTPHAWGHLSRLAGGLILAVTLFC